MAQRSRSQRKPKVDHRFEILALTGINLSQIDGDFFTGFDQSGINTGLQVEAILAPSMRLAIGMQYSKKGSKIPHGTIVNPQSVNDREIRLNYVEVPVLFKAMLVKPQSGPYIELGGSVSRLTSSSIIERSPSRIEGTIYSEIEPSFKSSEANLIAGLGFTIGKNFSFSFRYHYGLTRFYFDPDFVPRLPLSFRPREVEFLRNYHLSLLIGYRIL